MTLPLYQITTRKIINLRVFFAWYAIVTRMFESR